MEPSPNNPRDTSPGAASWADVISVSRESEADSRDRECQSASLELRPGDQIEHPKFGRCTVHRVAEGTIHMARETGRVIRLRQELISLAQRPTEGGKRVFSASPKH